MIKNITSKITVSVLLSLLCIVNKSYGQSALKDSLYIHLDTSRITSGVLYDRVYPWAELDRYNQADTIDYAFAKQAWYELYIATYDRSNIQDADILWKTANKNLNEHNRHTVGYIDYTFHYIDSNALQSGALVLGVNDSLLYDGNPTLNPYISKRISIPVINVQKIRKDSAIDFYFDPDVHLSNHINNAVTKIKIITPAGSISLQPDETKTIDFTGVPAGRIDISVELHISGVGITLVPGYWEITDPMIMSSVTTDKCFVDNIPIFSGTDLMFQGYDETAPSQGLGEYTVMYKMDDLTTCGDNKITRPLIFIDGFDPQDKRHSRLGNYEDGITYAPIWSYLDYGDRHLGDELRVMGYDIIILNFPTYESLETGKVIDGGADYIERNARVLIKLIQELKEEMADNGVLPENQEIVIVGPSMGGQISRYALSYMEQQQALFPTEEKWNHRTRLWLSFDSPHLGANIPIGLQQFLEFFGYTYNNVFARENFETKIMSTAAQQMLVNHVTGVNRSSEFFTTYYSNLSSVGLSGSGGYPQNTRRVALANGLSDGTMFAAPGSTSLGVTAEITLPLDITFMEVIDLTIKNTGETGTTTTMKAKVWEEGVTYFGWPYYSSVSSMGSPIPNVSVYKETIDMGIPFAPLLYKRIFQYEGEYKTTNTLSYGAMDVVQGGWNNSLKFVRDNIVNMLFSMDIVETPMSHGLQDNSCFIPTVSALGFTNYNFNWKIPFNDRNLKCANEIPFHNYLTAKEDNMEHTTLNNDMARWALEEIQFGKSGCPNVCATKLSQAGGDNYLCQGVSYTFSLDGSIPSGAEYIWETSAGLDVIGTPTSTSITVRYSGGDVPDEKYVRLIVRPKLGGERCGADYIFSKKLNYGDDYSVNYLYSAPYDPQFTVKVNPHIIGNTYSWKEGSSGSFGLPSPLPTKTMDKLTSAAGAPKYFYVQVNAPGCSTPIAELSDFYPIIGMAMDTSGGYESLKIPFMEYEETFIYPNPAENSWGLFIQKDLVGKNISILIMGIDGKIYSKIETVAKNSHEIDVQNLPSGVYLISVISGNNKVILKGIKQ